MHSDQIRLGFHSVWDWYLRVCINIFNLCCFLEVKSSLLYIPISLNWIQFLGSNIGSNFFKSLSVVFSDWFVLSSSLKYAHSSAYQCCWKYTDLAPLYLPGILLSYASIQTKVFYCSLSNPRVILTLWKKVRMGTCTIFLSTEVDSLLGGRWGRQPQKWNEWLFLSNIAMLNYKTNIQGYCQIWFPVVTYFQ